MWFVSLIFTQALRRRGLIEEGAYAQWIARKILFLLIFLDGFCLGDVVKLIIFDCGMDII